jgi:hypothetical protein
VKVSKQNAFSFLYKLKKRNCFDFQKSGYGVTSFQLTTWCGSGLPEGIFSCPKSNFVYTLEALERKILVRILQDHLVYFISIWHILRIFCTFFSRFGILCQGKSGNPGMDLQSFAFLVENEIKPQLVRLLNWQVVLIFGTTLSSKLVP